MNTNAVAKMLGVSQSTIQRWVKQANLTMERNELGHYVFSEECIEVLKSIQVQLNNGVLLQEIAAARQPSRSGSVKKTETSPDYEILSEKVKELERKMEGKADDVVTYQLLQHRREIEDLHNQIQKLMTVIESLEQKKPATLELLPNLSKKEESTFLSKFKRKTIIGMFFGL
ncbi:MerR family transcriptional regulator [Bacillus massilinigeriensis]|uniref:MerR family transcriptional regulator n=1 Tax=Bacillus mediterraneensis TaxID=1805474 RepID=UPI0008F96B3F|nr:MerR family transcriptional regulator [Bacillus mediterraneensis]